MGNTFGNISIKKTGTNHSEASIMECLKVIMEQKGYTIISPDLSAEIIFAVKVDHSLEWISAYSDSFNDSNPDELDKYGAQLSKLFKSPTLCTTCFDSDFLQLHLVDAEKNTNAYAVVGHPYDEIPLPAVDYSAWGPY